MKKNITLWDSPAGYGPVSRIFHWSMAFLFFCQFVIAVTLFFSGDSPVGDQLWPIHQELGFSLFLLVFARGIWGVLNLANRPPKQGLSGRLATLGHSVIYALMIAVPALALLRASGDEYGFSFLGIQIFKPTGTENTVLTAPGNALHSLLGWVLLVVVAGHAVMALFHHFVLRDDTLRKMTGHKPKSLRSKP